MPYKFVSEISLFRLPACGCGEIRVGLLVFDHSQYSVKIAAGIQKSRNSVLSAFRPFYCPKFYFGAVGGTRTPIPLRASAPQADASTNSATTARTCVYTVRPMLGKTFVHNGFGRRDTSWKTGVFAILNALGGLQSLPLPCTITLFTRPVSLPEDAHAQPVSSYAAFCAVY